MTTIRWADAVLEDVEVGYDAVTVTVTDSSGAVRHIRAEGYIAFAYEGVWDEMVIESAIIIDDDDFSRTAWESIQRRYHGRPPQTGSPARNEARHWRTLEVTFSDGSTMRCAAASFSEQ